MTLFSAASFNLYQYAQPGTFWYDRRDSNTYTAQEWSDKQTWINDVLADMDADIIGFQEVFAPQALAAHLAAQGYPHFHVEGQARPVADDPAVLQAPPVALASRFPIRSARSLPSTPQIEPDGLLSDAAGFRRDVIEAQIDVPGLTRPLTVFICHFKSRGARVTDDPTLTTWHDKFAHHYHERALAQANQLIIRTTEAMMLSAHITRTLQATPDHPILVIGDLNDTSNSMPLQILTQQTLNGRVAGQYTNTLTPEDALHEHSFRLYRTASLAGADAIDPSPTHKSSHGSSTIDFILASRALHPHNPNAEAWPHRSDVFNLHHLTGQDRKLTSDHAAVRVQFKAAD